MAFPTSPSNDDLHTEFGRTFKYSSASNSWSVATPDAPEDNTPTTQGYVDAASLPLADVVPGSKAFVEDGNKLFIFTGSGWFEIATVNTAPTITTGADASYTLNSDGTPTVITLQATDPEGTPIIWGYQVTSGSLEDTTVTNVGGQFTITPGATEATFSLTFTASDGVNIDTSASSFELAFAPSGNLLYTVLDPNLGTHYTNSYTNDYFGDRVVIGDTYFAVTAPGEKVASNGAQGTALYVFSLADGSLYWSRMPASATSSNIIRMNSTGFYYLEQHYQMRHVLFSAMPTIADGSTNGSLNVSSAEGIRNFRVTDTDCVITKGTASGTYGEILVRNSSNLSSKRTISNPNSSYENNFGYGLGLYGTYAYVGAKSQKGIDGSTTSVGVVYVFDITNGSLIHTITSPNQSASHNFGTIVEATENYIAVYASGSKTLYIYNRSDYTLLHTISNIQSSFGVQFTTEQSWSADGKYLIMGHYSAPGKVVVIDMSSGTSVLTLNNPNIETTDTDDLYGYSACIFNKKIIVGARGEQSPSGQNDAGYAYVYG